jgi:hypothetical protein
MNPGVRILLLLLLAALASFSACVQDSSSPGPAATGTVAALPVTPQPTVPPGMLESGPGSPVGVITTYWHALDAGDYLTAENTLLPVYRPGVDHAAAVRRAAALDASLYGRNGEDISISNLSVEGWNEVAGCDIHRADMQSYCRASNIGPVWEFQVSHDETEIIGGKPVLNHYDGRVYSARYNGTYYLIL